MFCPAGQFDQIRGEVLCTHTTFPIALIWQQVGLPPNDPRSWSAEDVERWSANAAARFGIQRPNGYAVDGSKLWKLVEHTREYAFEEQGHLIQVDAQGAGQEGVQAWEFETQQASTAPIDSQDEHQDRQQRTDVPVIRTPFSQFGVLADHHEVLEAEVQEVTTETNVPVQQAAPAFPAPSVALICLDSVFPFGSKEALNFICGGLDHAHLFGCPAEWISRREGKWKINENKRQLLGRLWGDFKQNNGKTWDTLRRVLTQNRKEKFLTERGRNDERQFALVGKRWEFPAHFRCPIFQHPYDVIYPLPSGCPCADQ
ncbi:hypothetical protein M3Y99_01628100 [Aphelenchoides fujianensis]|nr:hypothetical protein M3Y99_01628100 [Aphelenchoides fujianensis]